MTPAEVTGPCRDQLRLVTALQSPRAYRPAPRRVRRIETHISHLLLTGRRVYKIKKPVDLGFLDFRTIESRRYYCEEELRLNRRLAPEIYLRVVPICGSLVRPTVGGTGPVLDYAVEMAEFDQSALLSARLEQGSPAPTMLESIATALARFHDALPPAVSSRYGTRAEVTETLAANADQFARVAPDAQIARAIDEARAWMAGELERLGPTIDARRREGRVRECHGDLHIGNVAIVGERPVIFDCLEFSPALRWTDIANDVAFFAMDLRSRGYDSAATVFVNAWLGHTGDWGALAVLPLYECHRALIRAKVASIRARQIAAPARTRADAIAEARRYMKLALRTATPRRGALLLMHGLSGSGKTGVAKRIAEELPALLVRSDVERKRLAGMRPLDRPDARAAAALYSPEATARTLEAIVAAAAQGLRAGFDVVVDAASLSRNWRDRLRAVAAREGRGAAIVSCDAPVSELIRRVRVRADRDDDASDATERVVMRQIATAQPLDEDELSVTFRVDTSGARPAVPLSSLRAWRVDRADIP